MGKVDQPLRRAMLNATRLRRHYYQRARDRAFHLYPTAAITLSFHRDRCWQRSHLDRCARRIGFAGSGEMFCIQFIVDREILLHVREEDRNIDNVIPRCVGIFQHEPNILEHGATLRFNVVSGDVAGGIERDAGNFLPAALYARSDAGEKQKVTYALRVRKRAHWFRGAGAFERFVILFL